MDYLEKMPLADAAAIRSQLYDMSSEVFEQNGMATEPIKGGRLINLGNGYFARFSVSICEPEKVDKWRNEYAEQLQKNAEKAQARADKEAEKARKAAERAAKKHKEEEPIEE